ncbi:MICOS complex subunit MIC13 homolog QIL1-like [Cloeon dipterum]|uniref:MICOS complex subunit MIC13 homolog QIL1-like n=1 Tax=Cloeon dipterum TaxID=197152 RepID=UPI00321F6368
MLSRLFSWSVRGGLAGGAVYYSTQEGLWGDAKSTISMYERTCDKTKSLVKDVPIEFPTIDVPRPTEIGAFCRVNWNKAVYAAFDGLSAAPKKIRQWTSCGYDSIVKLINEPPKPVQG